MRESNHQIFRSILVYALALLLVWVMIPVTSLAKTSGQPDEALLSDTQSDPAVQRKGAGARLSGNELRAYNLLIDPVREVTEGKRTSTAFTLSFADVTGTDGSWTAEDLGLTTLAENGEPTAEAKEKVDELVSFDADYVCDCLGYNFPFDTFWYDTGCCPDLETSYEIDGDTLTGYHTVKMYAMEDCSLNGELKTTEVGDIAPAAAEAAATAKQIVADNAGKSVREQLAAYRDAICELVTYNDEAAADNNRPVGYVDQLIWVFDRAPDTNVVCGGYSKAFKYLCDLTWPDSDKVECLLVDGLMQGFNIEESHMWNIVRLDDGKNYLVDVTNCETGSVGEPDKLFLASADSGSMTTGGYYGFDIDYWITYQYSYFLFHYYDREQISVSVKTLKDVEIVSHDELSFIDWTDELAAGQNGEGSNASNSLPSQPGNWHLTTDVTLTEDWQAPLGVINLCLNGRTISFDNDHKIAIGGGAVLNIFDEPGDKGCITHLPGAKGCAVFIVSGGSFTLNGGSISGNNANEDGGGVFVQSGIITMNGGRISDNKSSGSGGGVYVEHPGALSMNGGVITDNTADSGGGVSLYQGTITLRGGSITGNEAANERGGIENTLGYIQFSDAPCVCNNRTGTVEDNIELSSFEFDILSPLTNSVPIGVNCTLYYKDKPVKITNGWTKHMSGADPAEYFSCDNGWIIDEDNEGELQASYVNYTVEFDPNGGSGTMKSVETIPIYELPECSYTAPGEKEIFSGWKLNGQGEVYKPGQKIKLSGNCLLTAQWTEGVTVTFMDGDKVLDSQLLPPGSTATAPELNAPAGCRFLEWQADSQPFDLNTPVTKDTVITVVWTEGFSVVGADEKGTVLLPEGWSSTGALWIMDTCCYFGEDARTGLYCFTSYPFDAYYGDSDYLIMPAQDLSGKSNASLDFWYHNPAFFESDLFGVYYRIAGGSWVELFKTEETHDDWTNLTLELPKEALAADFEIGFWTEYHDGDGAAVDDIVLKADDQVILEEGADGGPLKGGWSTSSGIWTAEKWNEGMSITPHSGTANYLYMTDGLAYYDKVADDLLMPVQDLSGRTFAELSFWYINGSLFGNCNEFGVYYRVAESEWKELFVTDEPHEDWTQQSVMLPPEALTADVQIAFRADFHDGAAVALDDIELTANKHLWNLSGDDSADRITANCANGEAVCEVKDAQSILSLIAEDTAYTGQPVEATVSNEDGAWSEQNELPAFVLEYFQGETKLDGAPVDIGDYTVRLTVGTGDSAISVSKEFSVFKNEIVNPFSDVKDSDYFFDPIIWAFNHDPQITKGTSDTTFSPSDSCTRGQAVTFLWRACGCEKVTDVENQFTDVKSSDYYYDAVLWAYKNKITTGTTTTTFSPNETCFRGQIVTFLWRSQGEPDSDASIAFTDVASDAYYYEPVRWAVEKKITKGTTDETFSPNDSCTRGQIVTFLYRALS